ncbi:MAG: hypothetical protein WC561_02220 [Candidatus Omnitrophota bacterium]|jgi:hypothetical protein
MTKRILIICSAFLFCASAALYAQEVTILFTGLTNAALYHCNCPIQADGGLSRRATFVKEARKAKPDLLLLDCGNFTAGGLMDEYSQTAQLDMLRTRINLKAMETMRYDFAAIGPDDLNLGEEFLTSNTRGSSIKFISYNLHIGNIVSSLTREVGAVKIGLLGLTGELVGKKHALLKPVDARLLQKKISRLKAKGAQVVIVISTLGETEDLKLLERVKGVDVLFAGGIPAKGSKLFYKAGPVLIIRPSWQGRQVGRLTLDISRKGAIAGYNVRYERLSDKVADDEEILSFLPACFSDSNCHKEGFVGACTNPAAANASCLFEKPNKVRLLVIDSKECRTCNSQPMVNYLRQRFPGLSVRSIYYPDKESQKLVKDLSIAGLPAYLLGKEAANEKRFQSLKNHLKESGDFYLIRPLATGISYFQGRKKIPRKIDLFLSLSDQRTTKLLEIMRGFDPQVHFVLMETKGGFYSVSGEPEIKADLSAVCVQKYYPQKFWDYLLWQSNNFAGRQTNSCLSREEENKVLSCASGEEAKELLRENIRLTRQLQVVHSPTYLLENRDIFYVSVVPKEEEIRKLLNKR